MSLERPLREAVDELAVSTGFKSGRYTVTVAVEHEFLYIGLEKRVTIADTRASSGSKENVLYLKIKQPPSTQTEVAIPWHTAFFNNVHYYSTVLPILKRYGSVPMTPKYYGSCLTQGDEYLILEDLEKTEAYKKLQAFPGLNKPQLRATIRMLSYFHYTVSLWRKNNPREFKTVCSQFKPVLGMRSTAKDEMIKIEKFTKEWITGIGLLMRKDLAYRKTFSKLLSNVRKLIAHAIQGGSEVEDQPWATIVNCFTYTTNFLFKFHTVTGDVIDVGMEDWGAARLGSPAVDLTLLLFSTTTAEIMAETSTLVNEYNSDHFSPAELKERHIPRFGTYGVLGAIFINIAKAVEDRLDMKLELVTSTMLSDDSFTSTVVPDLKARLVAIIKAAVDNKIL